MEIKITGRNKTKIRFNKWTKEYSQSNYQVFSNEYTDTILKVYGNDFETMKIKAYGYGAVAERM